MIAKKKYDDFNFDFSITDFMLLLGLSYKIFTKSGKKRNIWYGIYLWQLEKKSEILYNNYLMKCIKDCPKKKIFVWNTAYL